MITVYCRPCDHSTDYTEREYFQKFDPDSCPSCTKCNRPVPMKYIFQNDETFVVPTLDNTCPHCGGMGGAHCLCPGAEEERCAQDNESELTLSDEEIAKIEETYTRYNQK